MMERTLDITYRVKPLKGGEVPEAHVEDLEMLAMDHIFRHIEQGYCEGELFTQLSITTGNIDEIVSEVYTGYWECKIAASSRDT